MAVMDTNTPYDICVYGAGGIGGYFGARLMLANNPETRISLIARKQGLESIRSNGLILNEQDGRRLVTRPFMATNDIGEVPSPDLVLLCVKEYDLNGCITALASVVRDDTVVMPLLNGVDVYDRVRAGLPRGIVLPATVTISVHIGAPGEVTHAGGQGVIKTGAYPTRSDYDPSRLLDIFKSADLFMEWLPNPFPAIWEKFIFIAPFGLVTSAYGKTIGEVLADTDLIGQVRNIMSEIKNIADAKNIGFPDDIIESSLDKGRGFPFETKTSLQRDVDQPGKSNELDLFGGAVVRMGRSSGIETTVTNKVLEVAKLRAAPSP